MPDWTALISITLVVVTMTPCGDHGDLVAAVSGYTLEN
jgi:hypothetical protein